MYCHAFFSNITHAEILTENYYVQFTRLMEDQLWVGILQSCLQTVLSIIIKHLFKHDSN